MVLEILVKKQHLYLSAQAALGHCQMIILEKKHSVWYKLYYSDIFITDIYIELQQRGTVFKPLH